MLININQINQKPHSENRRDTGRISEKKTFDGKTVKFSGL